MRVMKNTRYGFGWTDPKTVLGFSEKPTPTHTRTIVDENKHRIIIENHEVHHGNFTRTTASRTTASA
jgi:hypothetical protein